MKSSGSAIPVRPDIDNLLQAMSITKIIYARYLHWSIYNTLPAQKTEVSTILIHENGDSSLPENFKPITLEPVILEIVTSLLRNRVFMYLINQQSVHSKSSSKGLYAWYLLDIWAIAEMTHIINHSRKHQQSVTITLIDLENVFGEVHQLINPICSTLSPYTRWNQLYC